MTLFDWTIIVLVGFLNLKGLLDINCFFFWFFTNILNNDIPYDVAMVYIQIGYVSKVE